LFIKVLRFNGSSRGQFSEMKGEEIIKIREDVGLVDFFRDIDNSFVSKLLFGSLPYHFLLKPKELYHTTINFERYHIPLHVVKSLGLEKPLHFTHLVLRRIRGTLRKKSSSSKGSSFYMDTRFSNFIKNLVLSLTRKEFLHHILSLV